MTGRCKMPWLWVLAVAATLSQATVHLVRPTTTYKLVELEADGLLIGTISAAYALVPLFAALPLGGLAQRAQSLKPLLTLGSVIIAVGVAGVATAQNIILIGIGSAALGLGQLIFTIAAQAAVARFATNNQLDMAFGWLTAGFSAGQMIGPLLAGTTLNLNTGAPFHLTWVNFTLWIGTLLALITCGITQFSGRSFNVPRSRLWVHQDEQELTSSPEKATIGKILQVPRIKSHLFASLVMLSILDILAVFLPLLGEEVGVPPVWIGLLLAVRAGSSILSRLILPLMRKRFSRRSLVMSALWTSGLTIAILPLLLDQLWLAVLTLSIAGFFLGLGQPLIMSMVTQAVPEHWRSTALAFRLLGNRVGQVIVPLAAGVAAVPLGASGAIWISSVLLLSSAVDKSRNTRH